MRLSETLVALGNASEVRSIKGPRLLVFCCGQCNKASFAEGYRAAETLRTLCVRYCSKARGSQLWKKEFLRNADLASLKDGQRSCLKVLGSAALGPGGTFELDDWLDERKAVQKSGMQVWETQDFGFRHPLTHRDVHTRGVPSSWLS